jgi:tyrosinase
MQPTSTNITRRRFLATTALAAGATVLPHRSALAQTKAKFTRYNVMSVGGKRALASYAKGVEAMLKLPADDPHNWFRNAFIHIMDCPHGNWWFYVWHRGYVGYFEETIRQLSGDEEFAMPYWDWTTLPQIPDGLFDSVLTPRSAAFEPYTGDLGRFTAFINPALSAYWKSLNPAQLNQLKIRGYGSFDLLWNDVTGAGVSGNMAYAITCGSRYLTRENPKLDEKTAYNVSPFVVYAGLLPTDFYNPEVNLSFTSAKTPSHNTAPAQGAFSVLENLPHNKVHNFIGGVGNVDPGPYGNMTNNLSPVDPVFFLHHSNMDRLWDVWTRKQKRLNLPYLPAGKDLDTLSKDPFLFFVDINGKPILDGKAADYLTTERFGYDYEPGFGEDIVKPRSALALAAKPPAALLKGNVKGNAGSLSIPAAAIRNHLAATAGQALIAAITLPHPNTDSGAGREFDVIVGAPDDVQQVNADSPYYAGTIAFFGHMAHMDGHAMDVSVAVPLPKSPEAFARALAAEAAPLSIRVVPSHGAREKAPALKSLSLRAL